MTGRPKDGFKLGSMREQVDIEQPVTSVDSSGQPSRAWAKLYRNQPARWVQVAGGETIRGRSVEAGVVAVFHIRMREGVTPEMRVVHRSGIYGIGYVKQVEGRDRYLELQCRQAVA